MNKTMNKTITINKSIEEKRVIKNEIKAHIKNILLLVHVATNPKNQKGKKHSALSEKSELENKQRFFKTISNLMVQIASLKIQLKPTKKIAKKS